MAFVCTCMIVNHHQKSLDEPLKSVKYGFHVQKNSERRSLFDYRNWPDGHSLYLLTNRSSGKESGGMIPAPIKNPQKSLAALVSASFLLLAFPRPT